MYLDRAAISQSTETMKPAIDNPTLSSSLVVPAVARAVKNKPFVTRNALPIWIIWFTKRCLRHTAGLSPTEDNNTSRKDPYLFVTLSKPIRFLQQRFTPLPTIRLDSRKNCCDSERRAS